MTDSVALMRAASNTGKIADSVRASWQERTKLRADAQGQAWDLILRAQIDEIFLVLAHLGEAILPLGVFNKDYYLQTLGDVKASLSSCSNELLSEAWEELDAELQYCCCAGFTICAHFSPMPVYRGFGACVLSDWDWGCPDLVYLEEKAKKKAIRTVYGVKQKVDPQPTRSVFEDFDQAIQILQVKPMAFFVKRPPVTGFADQPRFHGRPEKEVKKELDLLEDWIKQIVRRGHPGPKETQISNWGLPYATWTSETNYSILKTEKDCQTLMLNQMDPGRLLHAFVCRRVATLDEHSMFLLLPRSAAESLLCWLEGLPSMSHKIAKWEDFDTEVFEKKISKSLRKRIGHYPLPLKYAIKHPQASTRPELHNAATSPAVLEHPNTVSPPPYSPTGAPKIIPELPERERAATMPVAELPGPETHEVPAESPTQPPQEAVNKRTSRMGLKSIHVLRHRSSSNKVEPAMASSNDASARHSSVLRPGRASQRTSAYGLLEDDDAKRSASDPTDQPAFAAELPAEMDGGGDVQHTTSNVLTRKPVPSSIPTVAVQPPSDAAELSVSDSTRRAPNGPPSQQSIAGAAAPNPSASPAPASQTSPPPQPGADNTYLELLNRVARGDISPQALGEMLQNGKIGLPPATSNPSEPVSPPLANVAMPDAPNPQLAGFVPQSQQPHTSLPYPDSPSDIKQT